MWIIERYRIQITYKSREEVISKNRSRCRRVPGTLLCRVYRILRISEAHGQVRFFTKISQKIPVHFHRNFCTFYDIYMHRSNFQFLFNHINNRRITKLHTFYEVRFLQRCRQTLLIRIKQVSCGCWGFNVEAMGIIHALGEFYSNENTKIDSLQIRSCL